MTSEEERERHSVRRKRKLREKRELSERKGSFSLPTKPKNEYKREKLDYRVLLELDEDAEY